MPDNPETSIAAVEAPALGLEQALECLLFVADGPVPLSQLAEALEAPKRAVEAALAALETEYESRGLRLQRWQDRVQLTTAPAAAAHIERFLGLSATSRLSHAALETLAIVAYQQPVTRPQIEAVRGVNSDSVIKSLLSKGLVEEVGRSEGVGRPILYQTTPEFLQHFGLSALAELPPLNLQEALAQAAEAAPEEPGPNGAQDAAHEAAAVDAELPAPEVVELEPEPEVVAEAAAEPEVEVAEAEEVKAVEAPVETAEEAAPAPPAPREAWQGDWARVEEDEPPGGETPEAKPDNNSEPPTSS